MPNLECDISWTTYFRERHIFANDSHSDFWWKIGDLFTSRIKKESVWLFMNQSVKAVSLLYESKHDWRLYTFSTPKGSPIFQFSSGRKESSVKCRSRRVSYSPHRGLRGPGSRDCIPSAVGYLDWILKIIELIWKRNYLLKRKTESETVVEAWMHVNEVKMVL